MQHYQLKMQSDVKLRVEVLPKSERLHFMLCGWEVLPHRRVEYWTISPWNGNNVPLLCYTLYQHFYYLSIIQRAISFISPILHQEVLLR